MRYLRLVAPLLGLALASVAACAQQPPGTREALANLVSQPATHAAFTFDKDMLQTAEGFLIDPNSPDGRRAAASINSITVETFRYQEPAFYVPEAMGALIHAYDMAGWKHLVNANASSPRDSAMPRDAVTDLWLHFHGAQIDDVTVLLRAPRQMNLVQISGALRPLDLLHLGGHFGIPRVDPNAVMVPAPPGR